MGNEICLVEVHIAKITEKGIKFLALKRAADEKYPGIWQPVTGHPKAGEKAYVTAARELYEETGAKTERLRIAPRVNSFYNFEKDMICHVPVFLYVAERTFEPKLSKEHDEYFWGSADEVKRLYAWPGQRASVDLIEKYLSESENLLYFVEI